MQIDFNATDVLPSVRALRVPTGVGKTRMAVQMIATSIQKHGRKGGRPWVYLVPTHRLGDDIVKLFAEHGITARVWRGRNNPVPGQPDRMMCDDLWRVELALKCGLAVSETCCKLKSPNGRSFVCPYFMTCEYQKQAREAPAVWIAAHETLFHSNSALGDPIGVIIDESFWQDGLRLSTWGIDIGAIGSSLIPAPGKELITADLDHYRNLLADALSKQESGGLERKHLGMLSYDDCSNAIRLEWALMPATELVPGLLPASVLKRVREKLPQIQFSRRLIWLWEKIREVISDPEIEVSGRVYVEKGEVKIRDVSAVRKRWNVPTALLDATLPDLSIIKAYYPQAKITVDAWGVKMPHVTSRQFINAPVTQQRLVKTTTDGNRRAIRRHILQRWIETGRQETLVICQEAYEKWLAGTGLPAAIKLEHYNNVAGLDRYKHVRLLISIGRTLGPEAVESMAAALTGKEPARVQGQDNGPRWYVPQVRGASLKDGTGRAVQCDTHTDPTCEAIRFQVCEAELVQAIGRARGINRTAETPLAIDLVANVVLPIELDSVEIWQEPSTLVEAIADGVILTSRTDMWKCWPHVWPNETAAKRALEDLPGAMREQAGSSFYKGCQEDSDARLGHPSIKALIRTMTQPARIIYQRAGARMQNLHGFCDLAVVPEPRAWLEERLGPLAHFEVADAG